VKLLVEKGAEVYWGEEGFVEMLQSLGLAKGAPSNT
jgi:hypothetical protein